MQMGYLNVYYNDGFGSFPTTSSWHSDDLSYNGHLDIADVNGDGWIDVAVSYLGTGSSLGPIARVYLNNEGTFSKYPDWSADIIGNAFGVDFGDINNDGRPDLAVATGWSYSPPNYYHNYVYKNINGNLESSASWESDDINNYQGCLWLDADNDGWLDLAYIGTGQETSIYRNLGDTLETTASWETSDSSTQDGIMLTYGDINNDNLSDLFTTDNIQLTGGSGLFKQYNGLSEGFFEKTFSWSYYEGYCSAVALADVNGDNKLDLATGAWWDYTRIFFNKGSGFTSPTWNSAGTSVVEKIVFGNVGPSFCERTRTEYFSANNHSLFHLPHQPIQKIINVSLDGNLLDPTKYTYSREHGWVSVYTPPTQSLLVVYNYSRSLDMTISNWDNSLGNYLYYNQLFDADLDSSGSLKWADVLPGEIVEGSFQISNIGDPNSKLDWMIESFPDWGNWTINPTSGIGLTPEDGPVTIDVEIIAPEEGEDEFLGTMKVINLNGTDDYDVIPVSLKLKTDLEPSFNIMSIHGGIGVNVKFQNNGEAPASNVSWNIKATGGILGLINVNKNDLITSMDPNDKETVKTGIFLGLGPIDIQFSIECDEGVSKQSNVKGKQIFIFTFI